MGIHWHDIRHYAHSRALRYLGHVFRMDTDRTPSLLQRCWVVDGKQHSGKTKDLYDSAVQKLLYELGLSLLDASNKSEWHSIYNRIRGACCSRGIQVTSPSCRPTALCCHQRGCIHSLSTRSSWRLDNRHG